MTGDVGAIGRLALLGSEMVVVDLQGHRYGGMLAPASTHLVLAVTHDEARVEAVMHELVTLSHLENIVDQIGTTVRQGPLQSTTCKVESQASSTDAGPGSLLVRRLGRGGTIEV